ncbi:hypothetical protein R1sor_006836 [Riccia sorocarpa]|uniref:Malectin-like domain-containing protein n=1 Tax=Riccia sorocarpa TaxID=122646 RepID=A0ABD3HSW8_9MARC
MELQVTALVLSTFLLSLTFSAFAQAPVPKQVRIACGSTQTFNTTEGLWSGDEGYIGGCVGNITADRGKEAGFTYLRYWSMSDGPNNCYNITVPNGHYLFRFFFSYGDADNSNREPQFDVSLEGTLAYSLKPAWSQVDDTSYSDSLVFVDDGTATTCFHSTGHGNPAVVTIEILQLYDEAYDLGLGAENHRYLLNAVARVSCSAVKDAYGTSMNADPWGGDRYWSADFYKYEGTSVDYIDTKEPIRLANIRPQFYPEAIYQGAVITNYGGSVSYAFPIETSQNYSIWLHFAEIDPTVTAAGQRVFDVLYNDEVLFANVDIYDIAGGSNTAVVLNKTLLVDGKTLILKFQPKAGVNYGILVCAIEVYQVVQREFPTKVSDVWALNALKSPLGIPSRMGWIGDPCVPQEHPWDGIACTLDDDSWVIEGLELPSEGLKGTLTSDIASLDSLDHITLNDNMLSGPIPPIIGTMENLIQLNLADNKLNGTIPESIGNLAKLKDLYLQNNQLTGKVPANIAAGPVRGVTINVLGNHDLCGIPGLKACNPMSAGQIFGIIIGSLVAVGVVVLCGYVIYKRRENLARAHKIMSPREAPYAASHTRANAQVKDVQLTRFGSFTEQRLMSVSGGGSAPQSPRV